MVVSVKDAEGLRDLEWSVDRQLVQSGKAVHDVTGLPRQAVLDLVQRYELGGWNRTRLEDAPYGESILHIGRGE